MKNGARADMRSYGRISGRKNGVRGVERNTVVEKLNNAGVSNMPYADKNW